VSAARARRRAGELIEAPSVTPARRRPSARSVLGWPVRGTVARFVRRPRALRAAWWTLLVRPGGDESDHARLLESVARSLRGGTSLTVALQEAVGAGRSGAAVDDLEQALWSIDTGLTVSEAVDAWVAARPCRARVLAGAAIALGAEVGGPHARSLDGAAAGLRDRAELIREVRALTSQARASATVMVLAPVGFAGYAWVTDTRIARVMFATPIGWACLGAGVALDLLGAAWMARLAGRVA
jgi:Flp pilus assembly protein TadB